MNVRPTTQAKSWFRIGIVIALMAIVSLAFAAPGERKIDVLNFVGADIPLVLKALADVSGANIVIGPEVKGQVTLKLTDVTVEEALQIVTRMSGLAYGVSHGTYVVNTKDAIARDFAVPQEYVVVPLKAITPDEAISVLGVTYKDVTVKPLSNGRLVLSGEKPRLEAAQTFLSSIDVFVPAPPPPPGVEMVEVTYQVKGVVPWQAKQYLEELYGAQGLVVTYAPNHKWMAGAAVAVTAKETTSAVQPKDGATPDGAETKPATAPVTTVAAQAWESDELVLRGPKGVVELARASLSKVDVEVALSEKRVGVKRIFPSQAITFLLERYEKRGLAIVTAPMTYLEVSTKDGGKGAAASTQIGSVVRRDKEGKLNVAEPIGDFILRGPADVLQEALTSLETIDVGPERVEKICSLRFLQVAEAKDLLEKQFSAEGLQVYSAPSRRGTTPAVVANSAEGGGSESGGGEKTASGSAGDVFDLILRGPEGVVQRAQLQLAQLDTEPPQISISSSLISVDSSETTKLGIEWPATVGIGLTEQQSGNPLQLGRIVRNPITLNATLNALETRNKAKIISNPSTVVQNGREALIHVGQQTFYETVSGFTTTGPIFSTQSVNTGVTLKVRPQMSNDGVITLEITTNVATPPTFRQGVSGAQLPQFNENASTTIVQVRDGETLVIGGLKQSREETNRTGVPVLSRIPLLGGLFRSTTSSPSRTELLILVTPSVLRAAAAAGGTLVVPAPAAP